jgi:hypothetical protein
MYNYIKYYLYNNYPFSHSENIKCPLSAFPTFLLSRNAKGLVILNNV